MKRLLIITIGLLIQLGFAQTEQPSTKTTWSLQDCIIYAVENNITIKDAALDKSQADVDYFEAKSSRLPKGLFAASSPLTTAFILKAY